jgi:pyrroloquinoline quinone (PQQ) biosynthesis protein C/mannose-6-phosphate isomerase-like protein (cupin superfamily)
MTATVLEGFARPDIAALAIARDASVESQLAALRRLQDQHPLWRCALLSGFAQGALSRDDLRYIYSQYHLYSSSFTRYIAAVMTNCENDLFRAQLSENLWEEGGGCEPERRHAQIFRNFLGRSLGIDDVKQIAYAPFTRQFVREYLDFAIRGDAMSGAAFLSLGTEGIVARMYQIMRGGLRLAGIPDDELEFFDLHIACDDAHAVTLENMMVSYAHEPGWFEVCRIAMTCALDLRLEFFDNLFEALQQRRLEPMLARMHGHASLARGLSDEALCHRPSGDTIAMYANEVEKLNIKFTVERLPLTAEVLDPRMVRIPAGKFNEKHKHAHETLIHVLEGRGQILVDDRVFPVEPGDTVLVPRWSLHQTQNLGTTELRFLAVTDFAFSQRAFVGDPTDYRMATDVDGIRRRGEH